VQEVKRAESDERVGEADEQWIAGGEFLRGENAEPHQGSDTGEEKSHDESRLAQQSEDGSKRGREASGARDAIFHQHVGDGHAGGGYQQEEKAGQGHARLREKRVDMMSSSGLAGEGLRYHRGGKARKRWGGLVDEEKVGRASAIGNVEVEKAELP
jgi:hypothetical protein